MEKERGIAGYTDTQDKLEMISAAKGETDEKKGQILEDMSDMVRLYTYLFTIHCVSRVV